MSAKNGKESEYITQEYASPAVVNSALLIPALVVHSASFLSNPLPLFSAVCPQCECYAQFAPDVNVMHCLPLM